MLSVHEKILSKVLKILIKLSQKYTNGFAKLCVLNCMCLVFTCTLYNSEENYMNVETAMSHLKTDTCEADTYGKKMNIFFPVVSSISRSRL